MPQARQIGEGVDWCTGVLDCANLKRNCNFVPWKAWLVLTLSGIQPFMDRRCVHPVRCMHPHIGFSGRSSPPALGVGIAIPVGCCNTNAKGIALYGYW